MKPLVIVVCLATMAAGQVHIDPTAPAGGDGTAGHPLASLPARLESDTTYLLRRGTTLVCESVDLRSGVTIGAFGDGPRPRVESRAAERKSAFSGWRVANVVIRELDIRAPTAVSGIIFAESRDCRVEGCRVTGSHWGLRLMPGSSDLTITGCEIADILDDGIFAQRAAGLTIDHCRIERVNRNWQEPYTSQKEAAGDSIQFDGCDRWHVHHNWLDRSDSGNKFCFIANGEASQGVFEYNLLTGPQTTGDGGASIYLGHGGQGFVIRYNLIAAPSPGGIYHHTTGLQVYGNVFQGLPTAITSYGPEGDPTVIHHNVFIDCAEVCKGARFESRDNSVLTTA